MRQTATKPRPIVAPGVAVGLPPSAPKTPPAHLPRSSFIIHHSPFPGAYTLIEVMIVAVIVVLMLGMALPVFRVITGSRSEAGASNLIASMLGRARTDAIGLDQPIGVAVLYNPSSQLSYLAEVGFVPCPAWPTGLSVAPYGYVSLTISGTTYYYINKSTLPTPVLGTAPTSYSASPSGLTPVGGPPLDTLPNTELLPLPTGIGVQTICNTTINSSGQRITDGYLSFGVILFDGSGRMSSQNYGVSQYSNLAKSSGLTLDYPDPTLGIRYPFPGPPYDYGVPSQYGLVVYQNEAFTSQNFPTADPAYRYLNDGQASQYTANSPSQKSEEDWLDQNATPLLIDRYTGTLIRAE